MSNRPSAFRARIVLRPRSLDEVFDLSLAYLRTHFSDLWGLLLVATLLPTAVGLATGGILALLGLGEDQTISAAFMATATLGVALERTMTLFAGRHVVDHPLPLREALTLTQPWVLRALGEGLVRWAPVACFSLGLDDEHLGGLMFIALIVTGSAVFLQSRRLHTAEVRLLERLKGPPAIQRGVDLSRGRGARNLGFVAQALLLRALFAISAAGACATIFDFLLQFEGVNEVLLPGAALLGFAASGPFLALARLFDYVDARTRREGWDIQVRFQQIALRAQQEAGI